MSKKNKPVITENRPDGTRLEFGLEAGLTRMKLFFDLWKHGLNASKVIGAVISTEQGQRASRPRERTPGLKVRGLQCLLRYEPSITASQLVDRLNVEPWTKDDDNIEISLADDHVLIEDLSTEETDSIPTNQLRQYLSRARKRNS